MSTPGDFSCCDTLVALTAEPRIAGHHSLCPQWGLGAIGARVLVAAQHLDDAMAAAAVRQVLDDRMVLLAALVKRDAEVQRLREGIKQAHAVLQRAGAAASRVRRETFPDRDPDAARIADSVITAIYRLQEATDPASIPPTPEQKRAVEAVIDAISGPPRVARPPSPTEADWQEAERAAIDSKAEVVQLIRSWHEAAGALTRAEAVQDAAPDSLDAEEQALAARDACDAARRALLKAAEIDEPEPMGKLLAMRMDGDCNEGHEP